jgi:hypothetical protein
MRERYKRWLQILMIASGFVLLVVCANIANLMLVRGLERRRQTSLSMALGAQVSRGVREPLLESILLSLFGGSAGLAIAFAGTRLILHFVFPSLPGLAGVPINAAPSMAVLLFAFIISLATGVAFAIAPAWIATRVDPIEALRGGSRSTVRAGSLPRKALVVLQAALSLVLLSASGLLAAALQRMENQDFGFELDRRIVANIIRGLPVTGRTNSRFFTDASAIRSQTFPACPRWLCVCTRRPAGVGPRAFGWMGIPPPRPGMTTPLPGIA